MIELNISKPDPVTLFDMCFHSLRQLQLDLMPYIKALLKVMPERCILPRFEYGSAGMHV